MRWTMRLGLLTLLAMGTLAAGCGKKTMQTPATDSTPAPRPVEPTPPPPPPPVKQTTPEPSQLELSDVFFDYDAASLRDDARSTLTEDGRMMVQSANTRITIEGHCDERGSVDYNLALGERRAGAAKDFLVSYGVGADRIQTISYGENRPFAMGHDEAAWAQNRRAHFVVNP
jgi:peptidoglycan-associated lipoprotein